MHGPNWQHLARGAAAPGRPGRAAARADRDRVAFHAWLQQLLEAQLAAANDAARAAGMPIGIVHDLAVGIDPSGADGWLLQDVLAAGVHAGAPPDAFNQLGQDWGLAAWRPDRLAATGYAAYRDMLRRIFRHAGGLRVDHVAGLWRLWWVPPGAGAAERHLRALRPGRDARHPRAGGAPRRRGGDRRGSRYGPAGGHRGPASG